PWWCRGSCGECTPRLTTTRCRDPARRSRGTCTPRARRCTARPRPGARWSLPRSRSASRSFLSSSVEVFVGGQGQEVLELFGQRHRREEILRFGAGVDLLDLTTDGALVDAAVADPLPDLGAGDLCSRRVLHQVVD